MSKIKLLILLLTSFIIIACTVSHQPSRQFKLNYIGGNEDGLIFSNIISGLIYFCAVCLQNISLIYRIENRPVIGLLLECLPRVLFLIFFLASQIAGKLQSKFSQNAIKMQSKCNQNAVKM